MTQHAFLRSCEFCGGDREYDDGEYVVGVEGESKHWKCNDCLDTENFEATRDAFDAAEEEADRRMDEDRWGDR